MRTWRRADEREPPRRRPAPGRAPRRRADTGLGARCAGRRPGRRRLGRRRLAPARREDRLVRRLLQVLDDDARPVRAPRRRAQGRRALGAQRPRRPAHAGDLRRLLVTAQEGARPRHPDPAAVHAEEARRDAPPAALRAPARSAGRRHGARRVRPTGRRRRRFAGWWSATRTTCSHRAGRPACSSRARATGKSAWPSTRCSPRSACTQRATRSAPAGARWSHEGSADSPAAGRQSQARRELVRDRSAPTSWRASRSTA